MPNRFIVPTGHDISHPYGVPLPISGASIRSMIRTADALERPKIVGQAVHRPITLQSGAHAGDRVFLQPLGSEFISRMIKLQSTDTTGNTIFRDEDFLAAMFKRGDKAFGIVTAKGDLVAQAIVRSDMELLPDALSSKFNNAADRHAYIGSIIVDPDYKGNGLMGYMMKQCLREAATKGNTDVHARVVVGNDKCLENFQQQFAFATVLTAQSPDATEPRLVHFLHRKL